jgi:hypothetical protein
MVKVFFPVVSAAYELALLNTTAPTSAAARMVFVFMVLNRR